MSSSSAPSQSAAAEPWRSPQDLSADHLRAAYEAGATWLELQAASVNALNVFPVPDGDTGTNMSMTMRAAAEAASVEPTSEASAVARAAARGALMGARGNSGVILSQLLRGFAEAVAGNVTIGVPVIAAGLAAAADAGYRAVGDPVEGTILTVARRVGEEALAAAADGADAITFWERVLRVADQAVQETTSQLEALRSAGLVDAGGQGYRLILEGFTRTARGQGVDELELGAAAAPVASQALVAAQHVGEGGLGFCTEFLLQDCSEEEEATRAFMSSLGDSVIVVGDGNVTRVHVHTRTPGQALDWAVVRGIVSRIKVENMQLQHDAGAAQTASGLSKIGVIAVAPGAPLRSLFTNMGAASTVEGGQTMNPSVQDVLKAVSAVGYQELILLPNNPNILLAAQHAAEQTPRTLRVVPTRSLPQGVAALLSFNYEEDLETNVQLMTEAAGRVASIEVTRAVRSAEVQGQQVSEGQALGLLNDSLVAVAEDFTAAALGALAKSGPDEREIVTVYWGDGTTRDEARALCDAIQDAYSHLEIEIVEGGQPHYPYIISVE